MEQILTNVQSIVDSYYDNTTLMWATEDYNATSWPDVVENGRAPSVFFTQTVWYNALILLINVVAIFLNALIIYIVARYREMRSSVTLCFANFSVTDICLVMSQMRGPIRVLFGFDIAKYIGCRYTYYFHQVTIFATAMTMTFLAFDRYRVISRPLSAMNRRKKKIMLSFIVIWTAAFSLNAYVPIITVDVGGHCVRVFNNLGPVTGRRIYNTSQVMLKYVLPVSVASFLYLRIFLLLRDTFTNDGSMSSAAIGKEGESLRSRRMRGIRTAVLVLIWYALCYLPGSVLNMWRTWAPHFPYEKYYVLHLATGFPTKLNTLTNPFVYSLSAASFKKKVQKILLCGFDLPGAGASISECVKRSGGKTNSLARDSVAMSDVNTLRSDLSIDKM